MKKLIILLLPFILITCGPDPHDISYDLMSELHELNLATIEQLQGKKKPAEAAAVLQNTYRKMQALKEKIRQFNKKYPDFRAGDENEDIVRIEKKIEESARRLGELLTEKSIEFKGNKKFSEAWLKLFPRK